MNIEIASTGRALVAILPEIGLVILAGLVLAVDLIWRSHPCRFLGTLTVIGLLVILGLGLAFSRPGPEPQFIWGQVMRLDQAGFIFRLLFLSGALLTVLFTTESEFLCQRGEFFALLLISTFGMCLLALSADLIMVYLAFETTSIPLYVLAGFLVMNNKSVESGIKYMLFGAVTSTVMLFGFSWIYGFTGTTNMYQLAEKLHIGAISPSLMGAVILLVIVGFGFKISSVPFHFWAPDVYEGAPSSVAGFLSTASKAAGFVVLIRVLLVAFPQVSTAWSVLVAVLSAASMLIGNFLALSQKNIKRLLAYSSIAQAGYILIGVASDSILGNSAAIYYLIAYLFTNLAAFAVVGVVGKALGSDELDAYAGLSRRNPGMALVLMSTMLSLAGIPFFGGFVGKLLVFGAAIQANLTWLAILGAVNSILALYYYLVVLKVIYLYRSPNDQQPLSFSFPWKVGLVVCVIAMVVLGTVIAPWLSWSSLAGAAFSIY